MNEIFAQLTDGWHTMNKSLTDRVRQLRPEQLGLQSKGAYMPIWAIVGHIAGARAYWLCDVLKEPGVETTPFIDPANDGWEDHLDMPRRAEELLLALDSTWNIARAWMHRWTPETLEKRFSRVKNGKTQWHTYQYVFMRQVMHDAYHVGEISLILGMHGLDAIEPWSGLQLQSDAWQGVQADVD